MPFNEKVVSFTRFCAFHLNKPSTVMWCWKQCFQTKLIVVYCYNQRIFVIICEGEAIKAMTSCANVWPGVPSLPWWRNLLTSPLCSVTTITIITPHPGLTSIPRLPSHQPRSKITNKTKPPIVQATPNLLTGVTQPGVMFANLFSHSLRSEGGHQLLSHVSLPAPRDHWHAERGSAQIKLDWCQLP